MKTCLYCGLANPDTSAECERCAHSLDSVTPLDEPIRTGETCLRCGSARLVRFSPYVPEAQPSLQLHKSERRPGFLRKILPGTIALTSPAKVCFDCGCVLTHVDPSEIQKTVRKKGSDELLSRLGLSQLSQPA